MQPRRQSPGRQLARAGPLAPDPGGSSSGMGHSLLTPPRRGQALRADGVTWQRACGDLAEGMAHSLTLAAATAACRRAARRHEGAHQAQVCDGEVDAQGVAEVHLHADGLSHAAAVLCCGLPATSPAACGIETREDSRAGSMQWPMRGRGRQQAWDLKMHGASKGWGGVGWGGVGWGGVGAEPRFLSAPPRPAPPRPAPPRPAPPTHPPPPPSSHVGALSPCGCTAASSGGQASLPTPRASTLAKAMWEA
jgi:hypothetical protein